LRLALCTLLLLSAGASGALEIRVNAGGAQYTDGAGNTWAADTGFNTGKVSTAGVGTDISGTADDALYERQRFDEPAAPELAYTFPVPNGDYSVSLLFSENWSGAWANGARVFSVQAEGATVIDGLDIFSEAGAQAALIKTLPVTVADGELNLEFIRELENPIVAGIEIVSVGETFAADQVHLAWVEDPATTLTVIWRTLDPSTPSTLEYWPAADPLAVVTVGGGPRASGTEGTLHAATIAGLTPATEYAYRVLGDETWSEVYSTRTAPAPGPADFDVVYVADTGITGRLDGLATGTAEVIDAIAALDPLLVLGGGDYAYFDTDTRFATLDLAIDAWFAQMEPSLTRSPFMPTYGNHEIFLGEGYAPWAARFATPEGLEERRFYSFDIGDVHFVSILAADSKLGLTAEQLQWISDDITAARLAGQRWIIPYLHVPPFSDGSNHPSNIQLRNQLGPMFESLGVKVVLTAHDQSYERTFPLTDVPASNTPTTTALTGYTFADGVTWVKVGPGGKLSNINGDFAQWLTEPPPPWTAVRNNTLHHFARLVFASTGTLTVEIYGVAGDGTPAVLVDSFDYTDDGGTGPEPPSGIIRVNAGGGEYTDGDGNLWSADTGFNTGKVSSAGVGVDIAGTTDDTLYERQRFDQPAAPELIYAFPVANGDYTLNLLFSENWNGAWSAGARVFSVQAEGATVIDGLDIFAEAGATTALVKSVPVSVTDGVLDIAFIRQVENPIVAAIEIVPAGSGGDTEPPSVPTSLSATALNDSEISLSWAASTDAGGGVVAGYSVYRADVGLLATTTGTSFTDTGLQPETSYSYSVAAFDDASPPNASAQSSPATATTLSVAPPTAVIRVNAGGSAYTDGAGNLWSADTGFNTGKVSSAGVGVDIAGTTDDALYARQRFDLPAAPELRYAFPVANGDYTVNLLFSENWNGAWSAGARVFSVQMEGATAIDGLDIFAEAGAATALVKSVPVTVTDGVLDITFIHAVENPIVAGIEVLAANGSGGDTDPPSVPQNVTANAVSEVLVEVAWDPSTDIGGGVVAGYKVFRDGALAGTVSDSFFGDANVVADTTYSYTVSAFDNAEPPNESAQSAAATATTPGGSGGSGCPDISVLPCASVRVTDDLTLDFAGGAGGLPDANGIGTGFTMVDPPSFPGNPLPNPSVPGYWPEQINVDTGLGRLQLEATPGIAYLANNSQDNALGIGLNLPSATIRIATTLVDLPAAPGGWAQAGLWLGAADNFGRGSAEDDYVKLVVASPSPGAYLVEAYREEAGSSVVNFRQEIPSSVTSVQLALVADPGTRSVQARYDFGEGEQVLYTFFNVPDEWFSFDQAGIDPGVATRSYGGIFATSRLSGTSTVFSFDDFSATRSAPGGGDGDFELTRWSFPLQSPTSLVVGPDERLYATELLGKIHAVTLDRDAQLVLEDQVIDTVRFAHGGARLTLGLAVDPESTPDNVVLWVSHSDGSINNGAENSGIVSRLSGPDFSTIEDVITGLPRAIANHAINNIRFGPDGRLYIAAGGNTGAGAPNLEPTEFGDRPEQPLSAALLVADVKAPGFQGECATPIGFFGVPDTCDVEVFASGLRNPYDLVWHSNGYLYVPDNGLGVTGTYPPSPVPDCTGLADASTNNPGPQTDTLHLVEAGTYHGHPNPYRDECVFKDGSYQGVPPLANYVPAIFDLGLNRSANGIIEYLGDAFYSKLMGQLLIANYSVGDNITRVELTAAGTGVASSGNLATGFVDPLPLAQDAAGNIYVGQFGGQEVTVLEPLPLASPPLGGWGAAQALPEAILDPGGAALDGKFYLVGGKTSTQHVASLYVYDPVSDSWAAGPDLSNAGGYPAVENPAVAAYGGKLYVFGGSTAPFSGAVDNAAVFDPATSSWTALAPMPTPRGGLRAEVVGDRIYVVGGLGADGASVASVEIYDPATDSWSVGAPMQTRRDNPGSAVLAGKLYLFGGRTRNADGSSVDATLDSVEAFDPDTGSWSFVAPMPTGRRAMAVGTISGLAQVIGGENPAFAAGRGVRPRQRHLAQPQRHAVAAPWRGGGDHPRQGVCRGRRHRGGELVHERAHRVPLLTR
jgi:chitodextrinase